MKLYIQICIIKVYKYIYLYPKNTKLYGSKTQNRIMFNIIDIKLYSVQYIKHYKNYFRAKQKGEQIYLNKIRHI